MSHFKKTIIKDSTGNEVSVGLFGSLKTATPTTQISKTFDIPLDTELGVIVDTTGVGTGVAQYERSLLKVQTNGNGTASVQTKMNLRYKTASTVETYFTASWHGITSGADEAIIGLFDDPDGVYVGYKGTNFICAYRNTAQGADVEQVVDMSGYDLTKTFRFRIRFGFLGVGNITYEIFDGNEWVLLHRFKTDGTLSERTHVGRAILPIRAEVSSTLNDFYIVSGSWSALTYDKTNNLQDRPIASVGSRTVSATALGAPVVGFRNKASFGGYVNKVRSQLLFSELATGSEGLYAIDFYRYPSGTLNTGTWSDLSTFSVLEENTTLTNTPSVSDNPIFSTNLAVGSQGIGVESKDLDFDKLGVYLNVGDEILITKRELISGGGNDITAWSFVFNDLF